MAIDLPRALNDAVVRLAGARSYERGCDYYRDGAVEFLDVETDCLHALVRGGQLYTVALTSDDGVLDYACSCPHAAEGAFCKHCVAAALAWLKRGTKPTPAKSRRATEEPTLADAAKILREEDTDTLVKLMIAWAKDDPELHDRLIQHTARRMGPERGIAVARRAFDRAVAVDDFIDYREAASWSNAVGEAIDNIDRLLQDGQAAAVVELCESALEKLEQAAEAVDYSDGYLDELFDRLQDIHLRACRKAKPDPASLAAQLFEREMHGEFNVFHNAIERYSGVLGAEGRRAYRELAEREWKKRGAGGNHRLASIMEVLARASGNVEELVAVLSRDLSSSFDYLRIAEVYREARRHDQALEWAEKGLKAFPRDANSRLREFAVQEYHRRRRHGDAIQLMWTAFSQYPSLKTYRTLAVHAKKGDAWPEWRERALAEIRSRLGKGSGGCSLLVEIYLHEGDADAAWREAKAGGCSGDLWLRLARARESEHPADAAAIYLKHAEAAVAATHDGRYEAAVDLLIKAAATMKRIDRSMEFVHTLEKLRAKYKTKRNFIKLIERKRRFLYLP